MDSLLLRQPPLEFGFVEKVAIRNFELGGGGLVVRLADFECGILLGGEGLFRLPWFR
jgi:hypothetical protein